MPFGDLVKADTTYTEYLLAECFNKRVIACCKDGLVLQYRIEHVILEKTHVTIAHTLQEAIFQYYTHWKVESKKYGNQVTILLETGG